MDRRFFSPTIRSYEIILGVAIRARDSHHRYGDCFADQAILRISFLDRDNFSAAVVILHGEFVFMQKIQTPRLPAFYHGFWID